MLKYIYQGPYETDAKYNARIKEEKDKLFLLHYDILSSGFNFEENRYEIEYQEAKVNNFQFDEMGYPALINLSVNLNTKYNIDNGNKPFTADEFEDSLKFYGIQGLRFGYFSKGKGFDDSLPNHTKTLTFLKSHKLLGYGEFLTYSGDIISLMNYPLIPPGEIHFYNNNNDLIIKFTNIEV